MALGNILNTVGNVLSGTASLVNQTVSVGMSLAGGTLTLAAKGADAVVDGVASFTGMEGGVLHKTAQVGVSVLDTGASLTRTYDLLLGNTPTDPATVLGGPQAATTVQNVRDIINGQAAGVNEHSQALVASVVSFAQHVVPQQMTEDQFITAVFSGAHVVVADGGLQFAHWVSDTHLPWQDRQSSHYQEMRPRGGGMVSDIVSAAQDKLSPQSQTPQRGVDLPRGLGHLLVGRMPESQGGHTFFQLEGHGCSAREFLPHMADFLLHKSSGNAQVGPQGLIQMTEKPNTQGVTTHILVNPTET